VKKLAALLALYFSQGLPFGVQATALPLLLRERGVSLQAIGFASLLSAPWLAKALWAPLVDRYGSEHFGRRKSWIVPMQAGLAICALIAARTQNPVALAALILVMNLFAATQDIAVDALALSWLESRELGPGNAVQVVGYKLGMLTGGGLLVWASGRIGWHGLFQAMAALMFAVLLISISLNEQSSSNQPSESVSFMQIGVRLRSVWRQAANAPLIIIVMTYKLGESLADAMWKPLLFDRGFAAADIGLWTGTFGMLCSLLGSIGAGVWVRRVAAPLALWSIAIARAGGVAAEWWFSATPGLGAGAVIAVTCVEHLVGGAITTVLFTLMMRHTDRQIGATHYTLLASLEVWGKLPAAAVSGVVAARFGYGNLFALSTALCVAFALLAALLRKRLAS
jgi:MFS family permease